MNCRKELAENRAFRLGIIDLMTWIAFAALYFTFKQWLLLNSKLPDGWNTELSRYLFGVQATVVGLQLTSVIFCWRASFARQKFPAQAGHFLLLIGALSACVVILQALLFNFVLDVDNVERVNWSLCFNVTMPEVCVTAATTLIAGSFFFKRIHWLVFFLLVAARCSFLLIVMNRQYLGTLDWISPELVGRITYMAVKGYVLLPIAYTLLAVANMAYDFYRGFRDFLHIAGVLCFIALTLAGFASSYLR